MSNAIELRRPQNPAAVVSIMQSVGSDGAYSLAMFADELVDARQVVLDGQKEYDNLTKASLVGGVVGFGSILGAISIGSAMAPITGLAMAISIGFAIREYSTKTSVHMATAKEVDKLLSDATSEQWLELAELCGSPEDLSACLKAGLLAATRKRTAHGDIYRAAVAHSDRLGKMHLPGYIAPAKTGFAKPVDPKDWRTATVAPVQAEPTNAEVQVIGNLCSTRNGFKSVAWRVKELMQVNPAAGLNLAITSAGLSDRDYAKAGIPVDRLRLIKAWAASGDNIKPSVVAIEPVVEPEIEPVVEPVVAVGIGETQEVQLTAKRTGIIETIADSIAEPMLIVGPSQSGKTALSGNIGNALADQGFDIWFINLNYSEVSPVAAIASRVATCDMDTDDVATQRAAIIAATAMLKDLRSAREVVLIFDEFTMACTTANGLLAVLTYELSESINRTRSGGQKRGQGFIAVGTPCNPKDWNKNIKGAIDNLMILPLITATVQTSRGPKQAPIADIRLAAAMSPMALETLDCEDERVIGFSGEWHGVSHLNIYQPHTPVLPTVTAVKPSVSVGFSTVQSEEPEPENAWDDDEF